MRRGLLTLSLASLLILTLSCMSARGEQETISIEKIGLLAPFEGLYRQHGYAALDAVRVAIDRSSTGRGLLPLALDTSATTAQATRSLEKLLADPSVVAVIAPLLPSQSSAEPFRSLTAPSGSPLIISLGPGEPTVEEMVDIIAGERGEPVSLALAGNLSPIELPSMPEEDPLSLRWVERVSDLSSGDSLLWLGDAAEGAVFLASLRREQPAVPVWFGLTGGSPIFYQRAQWALAADGLPLGPVFWVAALDSGYPAWLADHPSSTPAAYAVYRATEVAMGDTGGDERERRLYLFQLRDDGQSRPVDWD